MRFWLTEAVLLLLLALALSRGGQPERRIAIAFNALFFLSALADATFGASQFVKVALTNFFLDCLSLVALLLVALRANRWWPLWASALQLIVVVAHIAKAAEIRGMAGVYWGMTTIPTYIQFIILLAGIRTHVLRIQEIGRYPDWREG